MYEPKPVKEQELKKSFSQMSLDERKTKKASQKNSSRKKVMSAAAASEVTSWQQAEKPTPTLKIRESMFFKLNYFLCNLIKMLVSLSRQGGAVDSGSSGLGSSPGRDIAL